MLVIRKFNKFSLSTNQATLNATEGATALNLNNIVEKNTNVQARIKIKKNQGNINK